MLATIRAPTPRIGSPGGLGRRPASVCAGGCSGCSARCRCQAQAAGAVGAAVSRWSVGRPAVAVPPALGRGRAVPTRRPCSRRRTPASSRSPKKDRAVYCSYISSTSQALGPSGSGGGSPDRGLGRVVTLRSYRRRSGSTARAGSDRRAGRIGRGRPHAARGSVRARADRDLERQLAERPDAPV